MTSRIYPVAKLSERADEEMIRFHCPICDKKIKTPPGSGGRQVCCPRETCKARLIVPAIIQATRPLPAPVFAAAPPVPAPTPEPTVPLNLSIPKTGMSVGTKVSQETANGIAKTAVGGALVAAGITLAAVLFGVRPPRST